MTPDHSALIERLEANEPLPICPYDRRSPEYWTTNDTDPCKFCGTKNEEGAPDLCRGADTRLFAEAAAALRARSSAPEACEGEAVAGAKALAFFKWARDFFWCEDGCEIDGGDFQDAAERFGLIVKVPFDPERHADNGYGLEAGDDWYETEPAVEHVLSTPGALKGDAK